MEAASLAWAPLGWKCAFLSEIDKAPCALLEQRYPDVPNFGDMTKFEDWPDVAIDLLVGGTPCQSFSNAGLRRGLADPRGSLMLTYGAIAKRYRPTWLLWENVPGVLSSNEGRDFGSFLGMLAELGYGFAYRVLDAQFFGLAQRRARVFVVGHLGDWRAPAAVLFERESLRGDSAPRRETGQRVAPTIAARTRGGGGLGTDAECDGALIAFWSKEYAQDAGDVSPPLRAMGHQDSHQNGGGQIAIAIQAGALRENPASGPDGVGVQEGIAYTIEARAEVQAVAFDQTQITSAVNRSNPRPGDPCHTLAKGQRPPTVAFNITPSNSNKDFNARASERAQAVTTQGGAPSAHGGDVVVSAFDERQSDVIQYGDMTGPLDTDGQSIAVQSGWMVRRLTPRECERLQGAPDDYTLVPYRGRAMADGPRYKMIGNSFAVHCVRWIGERVSLVNGLKAADDAEGKDG